MKKIIISIAALLAGVLANAEVVTSASAEKYAKQFLNTEKVTLAWDGNNTKASLSTPSFYVFNNENGGWVIISGDNVTVPVLGYCETGRFDSSNIPSNMVCWLSGISRNINAARTRKIASGAKVKASWNTVGEKTKGGTAKLLETAQWSQDSPYNNLCPTVSGESSRSVVGCVACAMGIVMRYHQWPQYGKGTLSSYKSGTTTISGYSIDGKEYKWSDMPLTDGSSTSWTSDQKTAVAELLHDCGVMVQMEYSNEGSGAMSSDIIPAMFAHMSYSGTAQELYRYNYGNDEWLNMIIKEIDTNGPVIYGGADESSYDGHQFVIDGYDGKGNVHVNWGWGGSCNGYFPVCYLGDTDKNGVNDVFNYYDGGIFGLEKDSSSTSKLNTSLYLFGGDDYSGLSLKSGKIAKGETFTISIGYICNDSFETAYSGSVKAALVDKDLNIKEFIGTEKSVSVDKAEDEGDGYYTPGYNSVSSYSCTVTKDLALGDAIAVFYKDTQGNWWRLPGKSDTYYESYITSFLGVYDFDMIKAADSYSAGDTFYFELLPGQKPVKSVTWYMDSSKSTNEFTTLKSGKHTVKAVITYSDSTTATLTKSIEVK